jgi:nicotinamidase-related amidase
MKKRFAKEMPHRLLVVVDLQRDFIVPETEHLPRLVEGLTRLYPAVIATRFLNHPGSLFETEVDCFSCHRGTPGAEIAFRPAAPMTVIYKTGNGLTGARAATRRALDEASVEPGGEVHLCGVDTDACVLKVALDLFDMGYRPRILLDACASGNGTDYHERAIDIFTRQLGKKAVLRIQAQVEAN